MVKYMEAYILDIYRVIALDSEFNFFVIIQDFQHFFNYYLQLEVLCCSKSCKYKFPERLYTKMTKMISWVNFIWK